ncbi:Plasmodium variant antigen protein Cir/Yir/Bir, putative [Plasmodium chabaudi adami]|uniref:Plasmodium variant antigen protein Cir/Yir/Bir, putative n=1 Tax=Plasmodium chabaudi adami TaxID=5826 RepID=A0A1C6WD23_PLACE|nr:Plasmodium variant antigen protein Cir/Yir/Bir, putative [Plasmodium chabaudi adami]
MSDEQLCKLFLYGDEFFNENYVITKKFNSKIHSYKQYCPDQKCDSNRKRIGALSTDLFIQLPDPNNDEHKEYFLMWLSDKLFKIVKDKNKKYSITLKSAYDEYLKNNIGNFKYWNLVHNIKFLEDANLRHMHELYTLLKHICNTIVDYKKNGPKHSNLSNNSVKCYNQYKSLYDTISGCKSYRHLLDTLKKIYDNFRENAIKKDNDQKNNIAKRLQELTPPDGRNSYYESKIENFDFKGPECDKLNSKTEKQQQQQLQSSSEQSEQRETTDKHNEVKEKTITEEKTKSKGQENENHQSIPTAQEPSDDLIITVSDQITEEQHSPTDVKENIPEIVSSGDIFNEYKPIVFSVIAIAIPVILAVMYKFLAPVWRKKMKKKNMKKIINLCDEKKTKKEATNAFIEKNQLE